MILKYGCLKRNGIRELYEIRWVKANEIQRVLELQDLVYDALDNKAILARDSRETLLEAITGRGAILGVFVNKTDLIAYRYIRFPGKDSTHLGLDAGLPEDDFESAVHLETTLVAPTYRGNHFQRITLEIVESYLRDQGYRHLLCTVSPENIYSLRNIRRAGFEIRAVRRKYANDQYPRGVLRFILHKKLGTRDMILNRPSASSAPNVRIQQ